MFFKGLLALQRVIALVLELVGIKEFLIGQASIYKYVGVVN